LLGAKSLIDVSRILGPMDNGQAIHRFLIEGVKHKVREGMRNGPPDIWFYFLILEWIADDAIESHLDLVQVPQPQSPLFVFVGSVSLEDIRFCCLRDNERTAHSERIRFLTSAHGEPALGFARKAASLFRRRRRVASESSICSGHSAMLSQISATS
jgi:hypothetical protein